MARAILSAVRASMAGAPAVWAAPTMEGDAVRPRTGLLVRNGAGAPITVTLVTGGTAGNLAIADPTISIPATSERFIGPFDDPIFPQTSGVTDGLVHVDYSSVTSVTRLNVGLNY